MLFNTLAFVKFFAIVFVVSWGLAKFRAARLWFLLGASYFFYAHWDFRFLPLLFASSTMDFLLARAIDREDDPRRRKRLLVVTVVVNLGLLSFFKYWGFVLDTAKTVLVLAGTPDAEAGASLSSLALRVALPVGISFYTFESMSYVIDVYRREMPACRSYLRYLLFVAFFPHLVAGPIVRPKDLLPQLDNPPPLLASVGGEGLFLIAAGLLKKVVLGDYLAVNLVDRVFDRPEAYSSIETLAGVYGYAAQIYCDFSGYTDIAIGCALLLGVRLNKNFESPYQSTDLQEFWRRWHMSLSSWLRDYLYIPLGGNRGSELATYRNLLLTMLLGGLWHGASWTFVFWGFLHGAALGVTRFVQRGRKRAEQPSFGLTIWNVGCGFLTFHYVCFAWVFFRAPSFQRALAVLHNIGRGTTFTPNLPAPILIALALAALTHLIPDALFDRAKMGFGSLPPALQASLLFVVAVVLHEAATTASVPFVYFQF
jgi:alginate O-acetyltransferase complex protein AlgI